VRRRETRESEKERGRLEMRDEGLGTREGGLGTRVATLKSSESAKSATICELYLGYCLHSRFARLQRERERERERERDTHTHTHTYTNTNKS
jgi:hypothetical protein